MLSGARHSVLIGATALVVASPCRADDPAPFVPGEVVASLTPGTSARQFALDYGSSVLESMQTRSIHRLLVPAGMTEVDFIDLIDDDIRVAQADLNFLGEDTNPDPTTQSIFVRVHASSFPSQPAAEVIDVPSAHRRADGWGVVVAVIDSGIDTMHPFFGGRILPGVDLVDGDINPLDAGDGLDSDGDGLIDEMVGHGTIVSGIILQTAPSSRILPIRALDSDGHTTIFRLVDGMYVAGDRGASVVNISLGTIAESELLRSALLDLVARQVIVVAAAGNDATDQVRRFPAAYSDLGAISVAATDLGDQLAEFSNFGSSVSICAPGDPVLGPIPGLSFGSARGTSFASPWVAGAAALVRSISPAIPVVTLRTHLLGAADNIDSSNPSMAGKIGSGRLNAATAVGATGAIPPGLADYDQNGRVDSRDLPLYLINPRDLDADGVVDARDWLALRRFVQNSVRMSFGRQGL